MPECHFNYCSKMDKFRSIEDGHCKALQTFEEEVRAKRQELENRIRKEHEKQIKKLQSHLNDLENEYRSHCSQHQADMVALNKEHEELMVKSQALDRDFQKNKNDMDAVHKVELSRLKSGLDLYNSEIDKHDQALSQCDELIQREKQSMADERAVVEQEIRKVETIVQASKLKSSNGLKELNKQIQDGKNHVKTLEKDLKIQLNLKVESLKKHQAELHKLQSSSDPEVEKLKAECKRIQDQTAKESKTPHVTKDKLLDEIKVLASKKNKLEHEMPSLNVLEDFKQDLDKEFNSKKLTLDARNNELQNKYEKVNNEWMELQEKNSQQACKIKSETAHLFNAIEDMTKNGDAKIQKQMDANDYEVKNFPSIQAEKKRDLETKLEQMSEQYENLQQQHRDQISDEKEQLALKRLELDRERMKLNELNDNRFKRAGELQLMVDEAKCKLAVSMKQDPCSDQSLDQIRADHIKEKLRQSEQLRQVEISLAQTESSLKRELIDLESREASIKQYVSDALQAEKDTNKNMEIYISQVQDELDECDEQCRQLTEEKNYVEKTGDMLMAKNQEQRASERQELELKLAEEKMNLEDQIQTFNDYSACFNEVADQRNGPSESREEANKLLRGRIGELKSQLSQLKDKEQSMKVQQESELAEFRKRIEERMDLTLQEQSKLETLCSETLQKLAIENSADPAVIKGAFEMLMASERLSRMNETIAKLSASEAENEEELKKLHEENETLRSKLELIKDKKAHFSACIEEQFSQQGVEMDGEDDEIESLTEAMKRVNQRNTKLFQRRVPLGNVCMNITNDEDAMYCKEVKIASMGLVEIKKDVENLEKMLDEFPKLSQKKLDQLKRDLS